MYWSYNSTHSQPHGRPWSFSRHGYFSSRGKAHSILSAEEWVDSGAGQLAMEKGKSPSSVDNPTEIIDHPVTIPVILHRPLGVLVN